MSLSMIEAASPPAPPHHLAKQLLGLRGRGPGVVPWSCLFLPYFSSNTRPPARVWVPPQPLPLPSHPTDDNATSTNSSSTTNALHIAWRVGGFRARVPFPSPYIGGLAVLLNLPPPRGCPSGHGARPFSSTKPQQ